MVQIYGAGKYRYGQCHIFALALHNVFGYQIAALEDRDHVMGNKKYPEKEFAYIPHVFCIKNGYIIDALGVRKPSTMIRGAGSHKIERPRIHLITYRTLYNNGAFKAAYESITKKNLAEAEAFILKHKNRFSI